MKYSDLFESEEEKREVVRYGLIQASITFGSALLLMIAGIILGIGWETAVFFIATYCLRTHMGGFHASTPGRCTVMSVVSTIIFLILMKYVHVAFIFSVVVVVCMGLEVYLLAPVPCANKPLDEEDIRHCKKMSSRIFWIVTFVYVAASIFKITFFLTGISYSYIFISIVLFMGIIDNRGNINHENTNM